MIVRCSIPFARIDETTPTVRATRTIPAVWPLWDAVAMAAALAVLVEVRRAGTMLYEWVLDAVIEDDRKARAVALASWAEVALP